MAKKKFELRYNLSIEKAIEIMGEGKGNILYFDTEEGRFSVLYDFTSVLDAYKKLNATPMIAAAIKISDDTDEPA